MRRSANLRLITLVALTAVSLVVVMPQSPAAVGPHGDEKAPPDVVVTRLISKSIGRAPANADSFASDVSGDCTAVAYDSEASNLVAGDSNGVEDVFIRNRGERLTRLVSLGRQGARANGPSEAPSADSTGRFVAYSSFASNLVAGDSNVDEDVFVRDLSGARSQLVSVNSDGGPANAASTAPSISANGRFVAFSSTATNLVRGDNNGVSDIFVRDLRAQTTRRASVSASGEEANGDSASPVISADGRYVAFVTAATNLVPQDGTVTADIVRFDRETRRPRLISIAADGAAGNGVSMTAAISDNGRYVAFWSRADNLVAGAGLTPSVFVRDVMTQETSIVSLSTADEPVSDVPFNQSLDISGDGTRVVFSSLDDSVVAGDTNDSFDVFLRNLTRGTTKRISVSTTGREGTTDSDIASVNRNGRCVSFWSFGRNLAPGDTGDFADIFLRRLKRPHH